MGRARFRGAVWLVAATMVGVACSGAPRPGTDGQGPIAIDVEPGGSEGQGDTGGTDDSGAGDVGEDATTDGQTVTPGEATGGTDGSTTGGTTTVGDTTTGDSDGGGASSGGGDTGGTTGGSTTTGGGSTGGSGTPPTVAGPYSAEQARVGVTDDEIYICGHAALIFAEAFQIRAEDLNVYFEMVNQEQGGIHGRKIRIDWEDDAYNPNQAVTAAQTCVSRNPFMLIGGIGFDQIPAVRSRVESQWKLPYIHHIAIDPTENPTYSFSFLPSVQQMGVAFGEYIAAKHPGKKVGVISRESENWGPGFDTAVATMKAKGVDLGPTYETRKDQHAYQQELFQLQQAGVEVVWVWESALAAAEVIAQANQQQYYPTWVVFPFQLTLDAATPRSEVQGVAAWPSYAPGGYGENDPVGHNADIALFERAYAKYRPNTDPNDLLYIAWAGHKALHQLLLDCGPDCDRNRLHQLITSGYNPSPQTEKVWQPNCEVNFANPRSFGGHYGGSRFYAQQVFTPSSGQAFRTTDYCWQRFS